MIEGFAKTDSWIEHQRLRRNAGVHRFVKLLGQKVTHFAHHIGVLRILLHGLGRSLHVHQYHRNIFARRKSDHRRVKTQRTDIVDDVRAGIQCRAGDRGFARIDGNRQRNFFAQAVNHRQHPRQLVGFGN